MGNHPTPVSIKQAVFEAVWRYNNENPDCKFPAVACTVIEDAIRQECLEHEKFLKTRNDG